MPRQNAFSATTDSSGLVIIRGLTLEVTSISAMHPKFLLPAIATTWGSKRREANVTVTPGATNRVSLRLEPSGRSPIAHY